MYLQLILFIIINYTHFLLINFIIPIVKVIVKLFYFIMIIIMIMIIIKLIQIFEVRKFIVYLRVLINCQRNSYELNVLFENYFFLVALILFIYIILYIVILI